MNRGHRIAEDLTGKTFNRLTVVQRQDTESNRCIRWLAICVCGKKVVVRSNAIKSGKTKSCGCWRADSRKLASGICSRNHLLSTYKAAAKRRGIIWELSDSDFFRITEQACHYCGDPPTERKDSKRYNGGYVCNGVDRKDSSMGYHIENVVPACKICNFAKGVMGYEEYRAFLIKAGKFQLSTSN